MHPVQNGNRETNGIQTTTSQWKSTHGDLYRNGKTKIECRIRLQVLRKRKYGNFHIGAWCSERIRNIVMSKYEANDNIQKSGNRNAQ